jgi:hypothetical protein
MHHSTTLRENDLAVFEEVPTTAVARTQLDLAGTLRTSLLESAVERAERLALLDLTRVDDLLGRCGAHPGRRRLRTALAIYRAPVFSRSRFERLLLALVEAAGLPRPALNAFVAGHEIDAYWQREKFAVEVDGWDAHRTRAAFERDPVRQENLKLAGIDSIRITACRIEREPKVIGDRLAHFLEQRRRPLAHDPWPRGWVSRARRRGAFGTGGRPGRRERIR